MEDYELFDDPLFDLPEFRYSEIQEIEGRTIYGVAIDYSDVSLRPGGIREMIAPGAFGDVDAIDCILHMQHERARPLARTGEGGLLLTGSPERLEVAATIAETQDGNDALLLAQKKILKGFSTEYVTKRQRFDGNTKIIEKALLPGLGIVDTPSYPQSQILEIRATGDGLKGQFLYDTDTVISDSGKVRKQRFRPGAFSYSLEQPDREISLVLGSPDKPLASKQSGSLVLKDTPTALQFEIKKLPKTSYARDFSSPIAGWFDSARNHTAIQPSP